MELDWHLHDHPKHSPLPNLRKKFTRIKYEEKSPLSLAVESAGGLCSTEGKLGGAEVAAALAVLLPALLL